MTASRTAIAGFACSALLWCAAAFGQAPPPLQPLPEPPPPPPDMASDAELEPQVTIIRREDNVVEEFRVHGELRYVRVTPRGGRPYYLVPDPSGATFIRRDSLDSNLKVPLWVLFSF